MISLFTYVEGSIFLRLLIAHLLTDFFLQPDKWVKEKGEKKWKSKFLWWHGLLTGIVCWIMLADINLWWAAVIITVTHTIIDGIKLTMNGKVEASGKPAEEKAKLNLYYFIADQTVHLLFIVLVWLLIIRGFGQFSRIKNIFFNYQLLLKVAGYLFVLRPAGYCVNFFTRRWSEELYLQDSLKDAGKWIGYWNA